MKTSPLLALAVSATTPLLATADEAPVIPATATTVTPRPARNSSTIGLQELICRVPQGGEAPGVTNWYYNSKSEGPYSCTDNHDSRPWAMLSAYREGGTEGVHWKNTDRVNDLECLNNWKYYSSDGQSLIITVAGRATTVNDPKRWCARPVYCSGGVKGKQWADCYCDSYRDVSVVANTTNASATESISIQASIPIGETCIIPTYGLTAWYYNSKSDGPYNAYRNGGTEGVHWKYTNDPNDGECLKDWKYYAADGQELLGSISGHTTTENDKARWCALPVFRPGGVEGKQWAKCDCRRG